MRKRYALVPVLLLSIFLFFSLVHRSGESHCRLTEREFTTKCLPYFGSGMAEVKEGEFVGFSQTYVYTTKTGDSFNVFLNGEESNWTRKLGIIPSCALWGGSREIQVPFNVRTLTLYVRYGTGRCPGNNFKPQSTEIGKVNATGGRVEIAYYFVPTGRGRWVFWPEPVFGGEIKPKTVEGHCSCSLEDVLKNLDRKIRALNFTEVSGLQTPEDIGPLELLSYELYRKNGEYLYVECARVKDTDLVRILLVKGSKGAVLSYVNLVAINRKTEAG